MKITTKLIISTLSVLLCSSIVIIAATISGASHYLIVLLLFFLTILTVFSIFTFEITVKPIEKLSEKVHDLLQKDLSGRITIAKPDEIGQLEQEINRLLDNVQKQEKEFETNVHDQMQTYQKNMKDMERFNKTVIDRELKMIQLKQELAKLKQQLHLPQDQVPTLQTLSRLQTANISQEEFKNALLNVLEDLEISKRNIEQEKIKDEAILESIGDGMITTDQNGKITLINKAAQDMLLVSSQDVLSKPIEEALQFEYEKQKHMPRNDIPVYVALASEHKVMATIANSIYLVRNDGTRFATAMTATPVILSDPVIKTKSGAVGTITIFRDTTKEKEVDRMKTEFISLASHQLRTPLSAIKWFLEMLLDGDVGAVTKDQKDLLESAHQSNERMIELVNSLLNISRIESGRIIIDPKPTDLGQLVNEIIQEVKVKLDQKKQVLVVSIHDKLPIINIDPKLIRQVYLNLLTNAIKYTPNEGEISVFLSRKEDKIISQISDNGFGIPQEEQNKVFQKFYRGGNIIKVVTDGNGLGLYLVKAIVESSHGTIWFESKEGKGTSFWFSLPVSGTPRKEGEVTLDS